LSFVPLGVLLAMEPHKDEWHVVINAHKFEIFVLSYIECLH